jgi:hypothetical protein
MPERIATAEMIGLDPEVLETDDAFPGAYGFRVRLSCDPGPEWALEFDGVYGGAIYPGKPPVIFRGDTLLVFYLPRYGADLPRFLRFLQSAIRQTNRAVEKRNSALPDEEAQKEAFRQQLRALVKSFK